MPEEEEEEEVISGGLLILYLAFMNTISSGALLQKSGLPSATRPAAPRQSDNLFASRMSHISYGYAKKYLCQQLQEI
jgi:hypothetical protein